MTIDELLPLIARGESELLEFKTSCNDETLETVGAFANTRGGIILIGITDAGEICGIQEGKKSIEDIAHRIQETTDPRLQPSITVVHHNKKSIITIKVAACSGTPISVRGRYFRRSGKTNQRMSHEETMHRIIAASGLSWDAFTVPNATISAI